MWILLDTNVLLRSAEPGHAQHHITTDAVTRLRQQGHELVVVPQVFYEFWSVATRPIENNGLGMSVVEAEAELKALKSLFRFLRDERAIYLHWEQLVAAHDVKGKKALDARPVAAMIRHAVTHLLTFNVQDFVRYPSVTPLLPGDVVSGRVS
jgi:predicted nucleic acid-binding protein